MFDDRYDVGRILTPIEAYRPFATVDQREVWEDLPGELRAAVLESGERLLGRDWPALPATLYLDFARTGNRSRYEGPYFARRNSLNQLVLAECMEGKDRFRDDIINGIWAICEETSWCIPAHNSGGALPDHADPIIDLFAGETGALMAWAHYLLRTRLEAVDERIPARMRREVKIRLLDPFLARDDFWWMGSRGRGRLNNWSPWCVSTCLSAVLLMEEDAGRRPEAVRKALGILDRFLAGYFPDGGCDEGPSYWTVAGGALFDCLELLYRATDGQINVFREPLVEQIGRYIYRAHISGDWYINFADCPARVWIPGGLVYRYGRRIGDEKMAALGAWAYQQGGRQGLASGSLLRALPNIFYSQGIEEPAQPPFVRDVWLDGIQVMAAREREGSDRGLYLAAKGGHNNESHNHNDVGQFLVYSDGEPVMVDPGVGTYTAKTFSEQRYEIWTMQSAYHNLPTVNGVQQREGEGFRARGVSYRADDKLAEFTLDLAGAYPKESGIKSWRRTCRLVRREKQVEVVEEFSLQAPTAEVMLSIMTPCEPRMAGAGAISLPAKTHRLRLAYDGEALSASVEPIPLDDDRLGGAWGEKLYRLVLRPKGAVEGGKWVMRVGRE